MVDLDALYRSLKTRSRMSAFRRLRQFDYLSSYTHAGRYYTLAAIARFDEQGLWLYRDIGFSREGTLKNTVVHLVEIGDAGQTHRELERLVHVRVHNTLLSLVREKRIDRQRIEKMYLYVSIQRERAADQLAARRQLVASTEKVALPLTLSTVIEVLVEVIQRGQVRVTFAEVSKRLTDRGVLVTAQQVEEVFDRYGLEPEKKRRSKPIRSRSPARTPASAGKPLARAAAGYFWHNRCGQRRSGTLSRVRGSHARSEDVPAHGENHHARYLPCPRDSAHLSGRMPLPLGSPCYPPRAIHHEAYHSGNDDRI